MNDFPWFPETERPPVLALLAVPGGKVQQKGAAAVPYAPCMDMYGIRTYMIFGQYSIHPTFGHMYIHIYMIIHVDK